MAVTGRQKTKWRLLPEADAFGPDSRSSILRPEASPMQDGNQWGSGRVAADPRAERKLNRVG